MQTPYPIKVFIVIALAVIVASLVVALLRLRRGDRDAGTVKALTVRIALSIALFLLLILGFLTGIIVPHGVAP